MPSLVPLGPNDTPAAQELIVASYEYIFNNPKTEATTPQGLTVTGDCMVVGEAVQIAARKLGILTSQELHFGHVVTSFTPTDTFPTPTDQILCFTWGQFLPKLQRERLPEAMSRPFFGMRADIKPLLGTSVALRNLNYLRAYAPTSLIAKVKSDSSDTHYEVDLQGRHYYGKLKLFTALGYYNDTHLIR
jgi:hypothetical protein